MGKNKSGIRLRSGNTFKKAHTLCVVAIIVLLYVLSVMSCIHQELNVYLIEANARYLSTASSIIEDTQDVASQLLDGVEHNEASVPMGTGNFIAVFYGEFGDVLEVWVANEMTLGDSIRAVSMFTFLDIVVFLITLYIIKKYFVKYKWRICALSVYQIAAIMVAWAIHSYSWSVLFGKSAIYVSGAYTLLRLFSLSFVMAKYDKSSSIKEKKNHLSK